MELFADDAELTWSAGTFRGKVAIRKVFEWDVRLSPSVAVNDAGIGVVAADHAVVSERVVDLTAGGVPYHERAVSIMELDEAGRIRSLRSYYDKTGSGWEREGRNLGHTTAALQARAAPPAMATTWK